MRPPTRLARRLGAALVATVLLALPAVAAADVRTLREATAAGPQANAQAGIQATVDAFRADLGDPNNGNAVGDQGAGRRQITWDGGDNDAAPARFPADFFNAIAPRGAIFGGDPRIQFQVSADGTPAVPGTPAEFGNVNATYPTAFSVFSSPRLFASLTSNVIDVRFFVSGTLTPAEVDGFGAVFTDVDVAGSTSIEFFDRFGNTLVEEVTAGGDVPFLEREVLATSGNESLSFLGVTFAAPPNAADAARLPARIARVRITAGEGALGADDVTQTGGNPDIVVLDDFVYGEPHAQPAPVVSFSSATYDVREDAGQATVTVQRSGDTAATVSVGVTVAGGTATAGADFQSTGGVLTFRPGETTKALAVPVVRDLLLEPTETVVLALTSPTSNGVVDAQVGAQGTAMAQIADTPPADTTGVSLDASATARSQRAGARAIVAKVRCDALDGDDCAVAGAATVVARSPGGRRARRAATTRVRLANRRVTVDDRQAATLRFKLTRRAKRAIRRALRARGGSAVVRVTLTGADDAGNETTARLRIKLTSRRASR